MIYKLSLSLFKLWVYNPYNILQHEALANNEEGGDLILISLAIWLVSLFVVRWLLSRHVLKQMNKASHKVKNDNPEVLKIDEIKAKNQPRFTKLDYTTNHETAITTREKFVKEAFLLFRKKYFFSLTAIAIYIAIPLLFNSISGKKIATDTMGTIYALVGMFFVFATLNYYFYRKQFRPQNAHFGIRIEHPAVSVLRKIVNSKFEAYFSIITMSMVFFLSLQFIGIVEADPEMPIEQNIWFGFGLIIASLFHLSIFLKIRKEAQKESNPGLLILRVFGGKKQTKLTFGRITNFWEHFGSWFTVVDPSFFKRKNSIFTFKTLFTLLIIFFVAVGIGMILETPIEAMLNFLVPDNIISQDRLSEFTSIPGMIIALIVYVQYWRFKISRSYAKDEDDIKSKLSKTIKKPVLMDLSYKSLPMYCYDNTWKLAVHEFIINSSVILMDLRGFSEERKGCEYEVDFLLDTFPINGVLFLVDASNDIELVRNLILQRWEKLRKNSPNLKLNHPVANIYASTNNDKNDVQTIIDLLINASQEIDTIKNSNLSTNE